MKKANKRVVIILSVFLGIFAVSALAIWGYSYSTLGKMNKVELPKTNGELGIKNNENNNKKDITNVLLMAVDKDEDASDTMIILTIDDINKKIKLTSIARDSRIEFGEDKVNKLNYAYHYGGPLLTIKTINENYLTDISNYMKVDFLALKEIIDVLGGVDINVKDWEITQVNERITNLSKYTKEEPNLIKKAGLQHLSGDQAVGYARMRLAGNADFERTERQRRVLEGLLNQVKDTPVTKYPELLSSLMPYIETSMTKTEVMDIGVKVVNYGRTGVEQTRIPLDGTWNSKLVKNVFYYFWDKDKNLEYLHNYIYGNTDRLK